MTENPLSPLTIIASQQLALLLNLKDNGFVSFKEEGEKREKVFHHPAAEAFYNAVNSMVETQNQLSEEFMKLEGPFRDAVRTLNGQVVSLNNGKLSSDFGYFACDAGCGPMGAHYSAMPDSYAKIEKELKGQPKLLAQFAAIKEMVGPVIETNQKLIGIDYKRSLKALNRLFLSDPLHPRSFDGFFEGPAEFVIYPKNAETKAELGMLAVPILRECANDIEQKHPKAPGAAELVAAAKDFAKAIAEKGFDKEFAALNEKFKALPPEGRQR